MKTISQPTSFKKSHKIATVTALAAACSMMFAVPAVAAESTSAPAATTVTSTAPSAIDSSKRVVRRAGSVSSTTATAVGTPETVNTAIESNAVVDAATDDIAYAPKVTVLKPLPIVFAQKPTTGSAVQPAPVIIANNANTGTKAGNDIRNSQLGNIPMPQASIANVSFVPTIIVAQKRNSDIEKLDVSLLDDFIKDTSPHARHYPPNFPNRTQRHTAREKIKVLTDWIEPYASASDASYDVLLRAAKLNGMGRNLDLGSDYTVRGGKYIDRAIKINPNSAEANFLYGMMLSEGGGFKEGQKYLDRAVALGYTEAEQSLAQSDLLSDRRSQALDRLRRLEKQNPDNAIIPQQIKLVEDGKYYIWDLSTNTSAKPAT
ncbi:hypothetical protein [Psychrobacter sp. 16-MNA-CIBAN-0192]|uniref:tetratricopeptide repeat protein n=1 Tax=Psychrobacter sp. 16-MNA-CIBAN-0192 TaxID=3140448 RepID=UPI00331C92F4